MIDSGLLALLPPLRRARGDRLYGPEGRHWVDLWKQGGIWLLGHRPEGAAREWKNQVDKGLAAWAPSAWPRRLRLVVKRLLPATDQVRLFRNSDRAPAAALWRPWTDQPDPAGPCRLVLPTGPGQAVVVAYPEGWTADLPPDDVLSPAEAAALVAAAGQVLRFGADPRSEAARRAAMARFDRGPGAGGHFERQGLWFRPRPDRGPYRPLFEAHLAAGFLLSPDPDDWSPLPTALSEGEWAAWTGALHAVDREVPSWKA